MSSDLWVIVDSMGTLLDVGRFATYDVFNYTNFLWFSWVLPYFRLNLSWWNWHLHLWFGSVSRGMQLEDLKVFDCLNDWRFWSGFLNWSWNCHELLGRSNTAELALWVLDYLSNDVLVGICRRALLRLWHLKWRVVCLLWGLHLFVHLRLHDERSHLALVWLGCEQVCRTAVERSLTASILMKAINELDWLLLPFLRKGPELRCYIKTGVRFTSSGAYSVGAEGIVLHDRVELWNPSFWQALRIRLRQYHLLQLPSRDVIYIILVVRQHN